MMSKSDFTLADRVQSYKEIVAEGRWRTLIAYDWARVLEYVNQLEKETQRLERIVELDEQIIHMWKTGTMPPESKSEVDSKHDG